MLTMTVLLMQKRWTFKVEKKLSRLLRITPQSNKPLKLWLPTLLVIIARLTQPSSKWIVRKWLSMEIDLRSTQMQVISFRTMTRIWMLRVLMWAASQVRLEFIKTWIWVWMTGLSSENRFRMSKTWIIALNNLLTLIRMNKKKLLTWKSQLNKSRIEKCSEPIHKIER